MVSVVSSSEDSQNITCPQCERQNISKAGFALRKGGKVQSYKCRDCGHVFTKKKLLAKAPVVEVPKKPPKLSNLAIKVK